MKRTALTSAGNSWLNIMGRVRPGLSIAQADAAFQPVWTAGARRDGRRPTWPPAGANAI